MFNCSEGDMSSCSSLLKSSAAVSSSEAGTMYYFVNFDPKTSGQYQHAHQEHEHQSERFDEHEHCANNESRGQKFKVLASARAINDSDNLSALNRYHTLQQQTNLMQKHQQRQRQRQQCSTEIARIKKRRNRVAGSNDNRPKTTTTTAAAAKVSSVITGRACQLIKNIRTKASSNSASKAGQQQQHHHKQQQNAIFDQEDQMNRMREGLFRLLSKVPIQVETIERHQRVAMAPGGGDCCSVANSNSKTTSVVERLQDPLIIKYYQERSMASIIELHFACSLSKYNNTINGSGKMAHVAAAAAASASSTDWHSQQAQQGRQHEQQQHLTTHNEYYWQSGHGQAGNEEREEEDSGQHYYSTDQSVATVPVQARTSAQDKQQQQQLYFYGKFNGQTTPIPGTEINRHHQLTSADRHNKEPRPALSTKQHQQSPSTSLNSAFISEDRAQIGSEVTQRHHQGQQQLQVEELRFEANRGADCRALQGDYRFGEPKVDHHYHNHDQYCHNEMRPGGKLIPVSSNLHPYTMQLCQCTTSEMHQNDAAAAQLPQPHSSCIVYSGSSFGHPNSLPIIRGYRQDRSLMLPVDQSSPLPAPPPLACTYANETPQPYCSNSIATTDAQDIVESRPSSQTVNCTHLTSVNDANYFGHNHMVGHLHHQSNSIASPQMLPVQSYHHHQRHDQYHHEQKQHVISIVDNYVADLNAPLTDTAGPRDAASSCVMWPDINHQEHQRHQQVRFCESPSVGASSSHHQAPDHPNAHQHHHFQEHQQSQHSYYYMSSPNVSEAKQIIEARHAHQQALPEQNFHLVQHPQPPILNQNQLQHPHQNYAKTAIIQTTPVQCTFNYSSEPASSGSSSSSSSSSSSTSSSSSSSLSASSACPSSMSSPLSSATITSSTTCTTQSMGDKNNILVANATQKHHHHRSLAVCVPSGRLPTRATAELPFGMANLQK